jgi:ribosomal protein S18 acetylase RimI-like enzyme
MITIEPITPRNVWVFKAVRLRALKDAPQAFSATYAKESELTDSDWTKRVERWNGETGIGFLAIDKDDDIACGIAGSFLDEDDSLGDSPSTPAIGVAGGPRRAHLISMWTAPTHRKLGVGRLLVNEVLKWARGRNARLLLLLVVGNNEDAIRFYERLGFTRTGRTQPYPNDPSVMEYEMSRPIL